MHDDHHTSSRARLRMRRPRIVAVVLSVVLTIGATWTGGAPATATNVSVTYEQIVMADGESIGAYVAVPNTAGPHPIVVMPSSWGLPSIEYVVPATTWATEGFAVVAFSSRGFWDSGGVIDIAGESTISDVSTIIDWMIANKNGDPNRVGTVGISYGAGVGLLAAAHDPRIDSVVALSGWADLLAALYPNETINSSAAESLLALADTTGRPGPTLTTIGDEISNGDATTAIQVGPSRSAVNDLAALEANGTALLFAQGWNDHIFQPTQVINMFEAYQGPKKLLLAPGDHGTGDLTGALGLPNDNWRNALEWTKRHVRGDAIDTGAPVTIVDLDSRRTHTGTSWASLTNSEESFYLTEPERRGWWFLRGPEEGRLQSRPSTGWDERLRGGRGSVAESPDTAETTIRQFAGEIEAGGVILGQIATLWTDGINRNDAAVWTSSPMASTRQIVGEPELSITVETRESDLTVIAYLYEETPLGFAKLITHKPYTIRGAGVGDDVAIDIEFQSIAWELNRGNRLTLVVDTADHAYRSETDERIYLESNDGDAAVLTVPFG